MIKTSDLKDQPPKDFDGYAAYRGEVAKALEAAPAWASRDASGHKPVHPMKAFLELAFNEAHEALVAAGDGDFAKAESFWRVAQDRLIDAANAGLAADGGKVLWAGHINPAGKTPA